MELSKTAFNRLVEQDIKGHAPADLAEWLRLPEQRARWRAELLQLKAQVETRQQALQVELGEVHAASLRRGQTYEARIDWLQTEAGNKRQRQATFRFRAGIDARLAEIRALTSAENRVRSTAHDLPAINSMDVDELQTAVRALRRQLNTLGEDPIA